MSFTDPDPVFFLVVAVAFLAGGTVKGGTGVGLPLTTVPLLATVMAPATAISLMVVPIFVSTVWLAFAGGSVRATLARFWPLIVFLMVMTFVGVNILTGIDATRITAILGFIILAFTAAQIFPLNLTVKPEAERWLGPVVGCVSGLLGGVSSFHGPPLYMYLLALNLSKDGFVRTINLFFVLGNIPLYVGLAFFGVLTWTEFTVSTLAVVPLMAGMQLGAILRRRVSQETFRKIIYGMLIIIGLNLIRRGLF
jgi:uncharacterized protein